jgi:hypothetical protein
MDAGLPCSSQEARMKPTSYSFIAVSPQGSSLHRVTISRSAILILVAAFLLSFVITVALLLAFPRIHVADAERARLAAENLSLIIENKNATLRVHQLNNRVLRMEETEKRINDMMTEAD